MFANSVKNRNRTRTIANSRSRDVFLRLSVATLLLIVGSVIVLNGYISLNQENEQLSRRIQNTKSEIRNCDREVKYRENQYAFESNREQLDQRIKDFSLNLQAAKLSQIRHLTLVSPTVSPRKSTNQYSMAYNEKSMAKHRK